MRGGTSWFQDHSAVLLKHAYDILGLPQPECLNACSRGKKEIAEELVMIFGREEEEGDDDLAPLPL
jgi:hypothetical protein